MKNCYKLNLDEYLKFRDKQKVIESKECHYQTHHPLTRIIPKGW